MEKDSFFKTVQKPSNFLLTRLPITVPKISEKVLCDAQTIFHQVCHMTRISELSRRLSVVKSVPEPLPMTPDRR